MEYARFKYDAGGRDAGSCQRQADRNLFAPGSTKIWCCGVENAPCFTCHRPAGPEHVPLLPVVDGARVLHIVYDCRVEQWKSIRKKVDPHLSPLSRRLEPLLDQFVTRVGPWPTVEIRRNERPRAPFGCGLQTRYPETQMFKLTGGARPTGKTFAGLAIGGAALALLAAVNVARVRKAERRQPPGGTFIEVDGVSLHMVERGSGTPLILLHGNGSAVQDFTTSGLLDQASKRFRVIALDRPGFGHSTRPRGRIWSPAAQADLVHGAARQLGLSRYFVLGHSWGASVALEMAAKRPSAIAGLVLVSGYFYPTPRLDALMLATPAVPVIGDILRYTLMPPAGRLVWPLVMRKIFGPSKVPARFSSTMKELAVRPQQLRATGAESGMLVFAALSRRRIPDNTAFPVGIVTGSHDQVVDPASQSWRLHCNVPGSLFHSVRGAGHMVHHHAPAEVVSMINRVADLSTARSPDLLATGASVAW
jgi:pimeloyl-ACP methyl ester carboxylesterase